MYWVTEQRMVKTARSLQARANVVLPWDYWDNMKSNIDPSNSFELSDWELKVPPTYQPDYGTYFC